MDSVLDDLTKGFKSFTATVDKSFTSIDTFANKLWLKAEGIKQQASIEDASAYSRACGDREAAKRRAELILQQLPPAYFDQSFDPLKHELLQMGDNTKQNDIDGMVERLSAAVEVVGVRLAKHVVKNQDKLVAGITNVAEVEDDLRAAHVICQGSRAQLRMAADEVQRQIKVITCTRKKQACMEVLEAVSKIKRIKDLHMSLRKVHEEGNYGQSIVLCADGFAAVEMLGAYKVAPELQLTVQRLYYDTVQRLDTALLSVCGSFTPEGYSTVCCRLCDWVLRPATYLEWHCICHHWSANPSKAMCFSMRMACERVYVLKLHVNGLKPCRRTQSTCTHLSSYH
eukprot:GHRR01016368.1.p1 GENE.GHRR01016368.1~~GHRR01016368.1.p1  ORF type:complete len:341 (+),score=74.85 GHRR01016368.1:238-1260(+)